MKKSFFLVIGLAAAFAAGTLVDPLFTIGVQKANAGNVHQFMGRAQMMKVEGKRHCTILIDGFDDRVNFKNWTNWHVHFVGEKEMFLHGE